MAAPEHRAGCEFRVAGRTLSGTVLRYGDVSPSFRERFVPGAFAPVRAVPLNLQHDSRMVVLDAGEFVLADGPRALSIRADLPPDSAAMQLVKRGALNGFSVEFHAKAERREGGVRVIERADLVGIGLVDQPSYPRSTAEVRQIGTYIPSRDPSRVPRRPREPISPPPQTLGDAWARSSIRTDTRPKACKCLPGESKCRRVRFKPGAFDRTVREVEAGRRNVIAHTGSFRPENVLGDTRSRALILMIAGPDTPQVPAGSLLVFLLQRVIGTAAGSALEASLETAPPVVRPLVNDDKSEFEDEFEDDESDGVRVYGDVWLDSILVKFASDESAEGWDYLALDSIDSEVVSLDTTSPAPVSESPMRVPAWL